MKKVNIEEKARKLNEFRISVGNKVFTSTELKDALKGIISKNESLIYKFLKLFPCETMGAIKMYEMPKTPIHKSVIENIYKEQNKYVNGYNKRTREIKREKKDELSEEVALALLSSKGYQIRRVIGFDMERFQKENPALYKKYLKYEII